MEEQPAVDPQQKLQRQARKQVPGPVTSEKAGEQPGSVNIWSGRRLGPRADGSSSRGDKQRQPSQYRCHPAMDTGRTRGSDGQINQFCLFFAKGMCYQGPSCTYLHRLPTSADNEAMARNTSQDIFGREKLPDRLDNREGAGSYDRDMTTLYVNYGGAGHYATPQLRHLLLQNFGEFGPIRSIYIVPAKTIAFVKYHWRASAEFAKEAMDSQTLTGSTMKEVLSVRWANDDPNPVAVIGRKREALDAAEAAAMAVWDNLPAEEKQARLALMHQAKARKVSAVADKMPEPLLHGAEGTLQGSSREQFDEWRGIPGQQQQQLESAAQPDDAGGHTERGIQQQQQQAEGAGGNWSEAQWAEYYAAHPEAYAQWQQYYQWQQQQQQQGWASSHQGDEVAQPQGTWYEGWRKRHQPSAVNSNHRDSHAAVAEAVSSAVAAVQDMPAAPAAAGGALGMLAEYGDGSDTEDESGEPASQEQQQQQQQQQQQGQEESADKQAGDAALHGGLQEQQQQHSGKE